MKIIKIVLVIGIYGALYTIEAKNSGILPYAKKNGRILFLLGRETGGGHKGTWADFGGGEKREDNGKVQNVAIREFSEETRGSFGKKFNPAIPNPFQASKKYIQRRMSREIPNPGFRQYYSLYLAEVGYIEPEKIARGPIRDHEKGAFDWVPAEEFIKTLAKQHDKHRAFYKNKQIRPPFAAYFIDARTRNIIKSMLGLSKKTYELSQEEGWVPTYGYGEEPSEEYQPQGSGWLTYAKLTQKETADSEEDDDEGWVVTLEPSKQKYRSIQNLKPLLIALKNKLQLLLGTSYLR